MLIALTQTNETEVAAKLANANGRACRNVATVADIFALPARAERLLSEIGLPASKWAGVSATWHPAGPAARAYKFKMNLTEVTVRRKRDGWYFVGAQRVKADPRQREKFELSLDEKKLRRLAGTA